MTQPDAPQPERAQQPIPIAEAQLIVRAKAGDREALGELLTAHEPRVFAICLRMVSNREQARDLTQETLLKALMAIDRFDERARLSTWLTRIAINACLSHLRKKKIRKHPSLEAELGGAEEGGRLSSRIEQQREPVPGAGVEAQEERDAVARALAGLPDEQRAILLMRDGQGMDYASIAEALGVKVGTVKSRLFRARAALRDAVERLQGVEANKP